jgi:2-C-methyl-D-erythritol 4-phosphate cytidylyltransferase
MMHIFVILLAGGTGSRTKTDLPKQFIKINDKYLAEYSILRFRNWFKTINREYSVFLPEKMIFVCHKDYLDLSKSLFPYDDLIFTVGGETRHDSTKEGLKMIKKIALEKQISLENLVIFIHDVARPIFLTKELNEVLKVVFHRNNQTCLSLASPVVETIVNYNKKHLEALKRNELFAIKTPQILSGKYLNLFLEQPTKEAYTDLITWASDFGIEIELIESIQENIKITYPKDFDFAKVLLEYPEFFVDNEIQ